MRRSFDRNRQKGARDHRAAESRRRSEATDPGSARQQAGDQRGQIAISSAAVPFVTATAYSVLHNLP